MIVDELDEGTEECDNDDEEQRRVDMRVGTATALLRIARYFSKVIYCALV